jgi:polyferredoxin
MKAKSKSDTWRWRRPTAWGLVILSVLAVIEGILIYCAFFPDPSFSDGQSMFDVASLLVGWLLVFCVMILLTEKKSVQVQPGHGKRKGG